MVSQPFLKGDHLYSSDSNLMPHKMVDPDLRIRWESEVKKKTGWENFKTFALWTNLGPTGPSLDLPLLSPA